MMKIFFSLVVSAALFSCVSNEHHDEFLKMKPDLEAAALDYCECMTKADTITDYANENCQQLLNERLIKKCGDNFVAKEFVKEKIKECIKKRRGDDN